MSTDRSGGHTTSTTVGFHLLPSELLHSILLSLPLPDLLRLRSLSRPFHSLISTPLFRLNYISTLPPPFLFLFKKNPPRLSLLRGFDPRSHRWFTFPLLDLIKPLVPPGEDLYFLAASGDFFLFASNGLRQLIAVNLSSKSVRIIPPSPLGPRGTSSWRRSALKLVSDPAGSDHFKFLFAELYQNRPVLFEYDSASDTWQATEAVAVEGTRAGLKERKDLTFLNVVPNVVMCTNGPVVYRPRFIGALVAGSDRLHVYGDGKMAVVRSTTLIGRGMRVVNGVEIWGLSGDGREWEKVGSLEGELVERIRKPYRVMMGCLEEKGGVIRVVLMSNCNGVWDLTWVEYDMGKGVWEWVPVPDCGTQGFNMAGIAISSTFVGFRP